MSEEIEIEGEYRELLLTPDGHETISRLIPIDREWLLEIGFRSERTTYSFKFVETVQQSDGQWNVWIVGGLPGQVVFIPHRFTTRGDMLDLLNGLKIL